MSAMEKVRQLGVLRVATVNSPTAYYVGPEGPTGFEYDLAQGLAERLGVRLEVEVASTPPAAKSTLPDFTSSIAAASLGITPVRAQQVRFSQPVRSVVPQLVYLMGGEKPKSLEDVQGGLLVSADSVHAERLQSLRAQYPNLSWRETAELETEELLLKVAEGEIPYTIANSDLVSINQRYYPKLRVAFALADKQELAWAFPLNTDTSLYDRAAQYLRDIGETELARLSDRHFGHVEQIDYIGAVALAAHSESRLARYEPAFRKAAAAYGFDWRLLAAIGYQESHWDPAAVSPTGVRGIMQLTNDTALFLKVSDRDDPLQSIMGGARYLRQILDQLPSEIAEPDRTWLALAAYNLGAGHLFDAQKLTTMLGGDATRWLDVRNSLPLLAQSKWHRQTKHGYARGRQAMIYVGNIRTYYDMLTWIHSDDATATGAQPQMATVQSPAGSLPSARPKPAVAPEGELLGLRTPVL